MIATVAIACAGRAVAQPAPTPSGTSATGAGVAPEAPRLRLEAQASREVADDLAIATLFVEREARDPAAAQSAAAAVLAPALAELRRIPGLTVRSGPFAVQPVWNRDGRTGAWKARGEVVVESSDVAAVSQASTATQGRLALAGLGFALSTTVREEVERALLADAARAFRDRATAAARALGYAGWDLEEATLGSPGSGGPSPRLRAAPMAAAAEAVAVPVEPGRTTVSVTLQGSVRLRR